MPQEIEQPIEQEKIPEQEIQTSIKAQDIFQYYGVSRKCIIELPRNISIRDMPSSEIFSACLIYQPRGEGYAVYKDQPVPNNSIRPGSFNSTRLGSTALNYPEGIYLTEEEMASTLRNAQKFLRSYDFGNAEFPSLRMLLETRLQKEINQRSADLGYLIEMHQNSLNATKAFNEIAPEGTTSVQRVQRIPANAPISAASVDIPNIPDKHETVTEGIIQLPGDVSFSEASKNIPEIFLRSACLIYQQYTDEVKGEVFIVYRRLARAGYDAAVHQIRYYDYPEGVLYYPEQFAEVMEFTKAYLLTVKHETITEPITNFDNIVDQKEK